MKTGREGATNTATTLTNPAEEAAEVAGRSIPRRAVCAKHWYARLATSAGLLGEDDSKGRPVSFSIVERREKVMDMVRARPKHTTRRRIDLWFALAELAATLAEAWCAADLPGQLVAWWEVVSGQVMVDGEGE